MGLPGIHGGTARRKGGGSQVCGSPSPSCTLCLSHTHPSCPATARQVLGAVRQTATERSSLSCAHREPANTVERGGRGRTDRHSHARTAEARGLTAPAWQPPPRLTQCLAAGEHACSTFPQVSHCQPSSERAENNDAAGSKCAVPSTLP